MSAEGAVVTDDLRQALNMAIDSTREGWATAVAERDRYREALEEIRDGLGPYRERLSSQQAKNAYDIAAAALSNKQSA